jgi:hypothetical protein
MGFRFACGYDPRPEMAENWNHRAILTAPAEGELDPEFLKAHPSCGPASTLDNKTLVIVLQECSARSAMYNTEVLFNRVKECTEETIRRLDLLADKGGVSDAMVKRACNAYDTSGLVVEPAEYPAMFAALTAALAGG